MFRKLLPIAATIGISASVGYIVGKYPPKVRTSRSSKQKKLKVFLIGFGNAGKSLAQVVTESYCQKMLDLGKQIVFVAITTKTRGILYNPEGIDVVRAIQEIGNTMKFDPKNSDYSKKNQQWLLENIDYDVLIELSTLNIEGKGEPAITHVQTALKRGIHVISGNKGPLAFQFQELSDLAKSNNCILLYEACVMDGCPIFNLARHTLKGCNVTALSGILNSTTNFVLSEMERGNTLQMAVTKAQEKGFAEADPSLDLEGWDAACKITVLANALMGAKMTPHDVERSGINDVTINAAQKANQNGKRLKLIARAWKDHAQKVCASVKVEEVEKSNPFSAVDGEGSALTYSTDVMCDILILQTTPGLLDTAYGVGDDLLSLLQLTGNP